MERGNWIFSFFLVGVVCFVLATASTYTWSFFFFPGKNSARTTPSQGSRKLCELVVVAVVRVSLWRTLWAFGVNKLLRGGLPNINIYFVEAA